MNKYSVPDSPNLYKPLSKNNRKNPSQITAKIHNKKLKIIKQRKTSAI